jgi:hypothetical protein
MLFKIKCGYDAHVCAYDTGAINLARTVGVVNAAGAVGVVNAACTVGVVNAAHTHRRGPIYRAHAPAPFMGEGSLHAIKFT